MRNLSIFLEISIVLLAIGCRKSPELATDFIPQFNRSVEVNITEKKIEFKTSFTQLNSSNTDNSGFEWSERYGSKIKIFNIGKPNSGEFGMKIDTSLSETLSYKVRAWVKVGEKLFYSNYAYFTGLGFPAPEIISVSKNYAYWGETFYIFGKYFTDSYHNTDIIVNINNIQCQVVSASENAIGVVMPDIETRGRVKIVINIKGKIIQPEPEIDNYRPEVFSVSPQAMTLNEEITIKGNFHSEYKDIIIPVQKGTDLFYYPGYSIIKYSDEEIILKRPIYDYCDTLYQIYFRLKQYNYDEYKFLNSGFSVKRTGNWVKLNNTPFTSFDKGLSYDGNGYVIQFLANASEFPLWRYNQQSDTWTKLASFPGNYRLDPVFVESKGIIYCGLGKKNEYYQLMTDFWKYDLVNNIWTKCADLNFKSTDGVSIFCTNIKDNVYIFSEWNNQKAIYNSSSDSWIISNCNVPRLHDFSSTFIYNDEYYFFSDLYQHTMYKFNLSTLQFDGIDINNMDRGGGNAFNVKGRIYSNFGCYLSEIDMLNKTVIELYKYADNVSPDKPSREMFIINDKPYFFFQPKGMSTVLIE